MTPAHATPRLSIAPPASASPASESATVDALWRTLAAAGARDRHALADRLAEVAWERLRIAA